MMSNEEIAALLEKLIQNGEDEVVEFKKAKNNYSSNKLGLYFSALANQAGLRGLNQAWLVFGIDDKSLKVVGSKCLQNSKDLQRTKMEMYENTDPHTTFRNVYEYQHPQGRVILFEIPAAPPGLPISWKKYHHSRVGESLGPLTPDEFNQFRQQIIKSDWSAEVVPGATFEDLDKKAIKRAQELFAEKQDKITTDEVRTWPLSTFLDRALLTQNGKLTRTAILLLGKPEAIHLLTPHPAQMVWKLVGTERANEHFGPPFLLNTTALYQKIRNIQIRILPENTLLPVEISKYDQKIVLEALHNCIAHQDYTLDGRIMVTEHPDKLTLENKGNFFEGEPEDYVTCEKSPLRHRNTFLIGAMKELNMIDRMGYGIHDMHKWQAERFLPMPDYDLKTPQEVKMTIYGRVVNLAYSRLLIKMRDTDPSMDAILALDRAQKQTPGNNDLTQTQYDDFYCKLVIGYIRRYGKASRGDIDKLLLNILSDTQNDDQKKKRISNLITKMRRKGQIENRGDRKNSQWYLV